MVRLTSTVTGDVTTPDGADSIVAAAAAAMDGLDGLAVTTGLTGHLRLEQASDEDWSAAFDDVLMGRA